jgi:hypothetical protein
METKTGWEKAEDLILELHRGGSGVPTARTAVAQGETEGERLLGLIHAAGPNRVAPKCLTCLGRTTQCECSDDPNCRFSLLATVQKILDTLWVAKVMGKAGENRLI